MCIFVKTSKTTCQPQLYRQKIVSPAKSARSKQQNKRLRHLVKDRNMNVRDEASPVYDGVAHRCSSTCDDIQRSNLTRHNTEARPPAKVSNQWRPETGSASSVTSTAKCECGLRVGGWHMIFPFSLTRWHGVQTFCARHMGIKNPRGEKGQVHRAGHASCAKDRVALPLVPQIADPPG